MSETFFTGFTAYVQDWRGMAAMTPVQVVHAREANAAVATLHEALKYALKHVEKYAHTQGDNAEFHAEITAPIRAALSKVSQQTDTPQADGAKDSEAKSNGAA